MVTGSCVLPKLTDSRTTLTLPSCLILPLSSTRKTAATLLQHGCYLASSWQCLPKSEKQRNKEVPVCGDHFFIPGIMFHKWVPLKQIFEILISLQAQKGYILAESHKQ